jgi:hypothetical protein
MMGAPTRKMRLAHARVHCSLWNEGHREEWIRSWRTLVPGEVRMFDPVGTREKVGFEHATSEAYDKFREHLTMHMIAVHVNGDEMAWVIENRFTLDGVTLTTHSIETFAWDERGDLLIKTYYDMPESVTAGDDPHEFLFR